MKRLVIGFGMLAFVVVSQGCADDAATRPDTADEEALPVVTVVESDDYASESPSEDESNASSRFERQHVFPCRGCGPVPDPWEGVAGPVPDPWDPDRPEPSQDDDDSDVDESKPKRKH